MQKATTADFSPFDASDWRVAIVVAQFNRDITDQLHQTALARANDYDLKPANIDSFKVAGAIELPLVLQKLAASGDYQALVAIGCVIKGETPHFDYVCKFVSEGVLRVQLDQKVPIAFGILTCNNESEAQARAQLGGDYLDAVMHQAKVLGQIK